MSTHIFYNAAKKFSHIDGTQWASAFAYNAFFSLFPLIILFVTIASFFVDGERASQEIISYLESYVPLSGQMHQQIFGTITNVVAARGSASIIAMIFLIWVALQCFSTLICATNRAWGVPMYSWWRLPLKSLSLFSIITVAILLGIAVPAIVRLLTDWFGSFFIPIIVEFFSLSLFYKLAPRRRTRFSEVWFSAFIATLLLQITGGLFVLYLKYFATLNVLYGAFGGIMALLLWIYLSGCIFIFGACLCAAEKKS
jgi:YihY family inner membrane protein